MDMENDYRGHYPIMYKSDIKIVDKLQTLTNIETFWDDVRRLTKRIHSDRYLRHWQAYAEIRFNILMKGRTDYDKTSIDTEKN